MLTVTLVLLHWGIILLHNAVSLSAARGRAMAPAQRLLQWPPVAGYAFYSGTATGYGFFAPAVGSNYMLHVALFNTQGYLLHEGTHPGLRSAEGRLRYQAFLDIFSELLPAQGISTTSHPGTLEARYARAVARSIGKRLAARYGAATIRCLIALYRHPPLQAGSNSPSSPVIIYETTFTNPAADVPLPVPPYR